MLSKTDGECCDLRVIDGDGLTDCFRCFARLDALPV